MATYIRVDRTRQLVATAQQRMAENRFLQQDQREQQAAQQQITQSVEARRQALAPAGAFLQGGKRRQGPAEEPTGLMRRKDYYMLFLFDFVTVPFQSYVQADITYGQLPLVSIRDDYNPNGRNALMHLAATTRQKKRVDAAIKQGFEAIAPGNTGIWQQFTSGRVPYTKNVISKPVARSSVSLKVIGSSDIDSERIQGIYVSYGQIGKWSDWQLVAGIFFPSFEQTIQIVWSKPTP